MESKKSKENIKSIYSCEICQKKFRSDKQYRKHLDKKDCHYKLNKCSGKIIKKLKKEPKSYPCKKCSDRFETFTKLKEHRKSHKTDIEEEHTHYYDDAQEIFICNTCSAEFQDKAEADTHLKSHVEKFQCMLCPKYFDTMRKLGIHSKEHANDGVYSCPICTDTDLNSKSSLVHHINKKHLLKKYGYPCKQCHQMFRSKIQAKEHENVHNGIKPFLCIVCGASFAFSKSVLVHQLKSHRVEIRKDFVAFECGFCFKLFASKETFKKHILKTHKIGDKDKQKNHLCENCGKAFDYKYEMETHMRIHTGVKPYVCQWCNKGFRKSWELSCHKRVHTGERPYTCQYCGKTFSYSAPFKVHIRTHTGEKPYVCNVCMKGFTTNQGLRHHKNNCENIMPFNNE